MFLIKNFKNLNKEDVSIAGGKGASLGEMTQAGIPVPDGFVILANTFEKFIEETDLNVEIESILKKVNIKKTHTIEDASEQIQALILSKDIPQNIKIEILKFYKNLNCKFVAVRSSATSEDSADAAWAGQLDSFLNTTEKTFLENVKKCWASLFTPRAIFYRFEKKLNQTKISVAVVVQKMVQSEMSGIAFSVHPVTEDENQIIIEAGFGLGEAIVSGSITPDSYVVHKKEMNILDINVSEQTKALYKKANGGNEWKELGEKGKTQVLNKKEIIELSKLIVKIEDHYGFPCDIEWAREKNKFYIVQSRPITTLKNFSKKKDNKKKSKKKEKQNFLFKENVLINFEDFKKKYQEDEWKKVGNWEVSRSVFDLFCCSQTKQFLKKYGIEDIPPIKYLVIKNDVFVATKELNLIDKTIFKKINEGDYKFIDNFASLQSKFRKELEEKIKLIQKKKNFDKNFITSFLEKTMTILVVFEILRSMSNFLEKAVEKRFDELKIKKISLPDLLKPEQITDTYKFNKELYLLSKQKKIDNKKIEKIIKKYGYLKQYFLSGDAYTKKDILEQIKLSHKQEKNIFKYNFKDKKLNRLIHIVNDFSVIRMLNNEITNKAFFYLKPFFISIAKKNELTYDQILSLPFEEIKNLLDNKQINLKKELLGNNVAFLSSEKNFILSPTDTDVFLKKNIEEKKEINKIEGQTTYGGVVRGNVKIIMGSSDFYKFEENDILVCSMTVPNYVPLMKKAAAFVTDIGGILCHAAIISREMKKPCIIGTKNATQILKDGDYVEVDADNGVVRILNNNKEQITVGSADDFWKKSWSLKYNLLLSSYSAEQYTKELFKYIGADIPRTIIICKDGISTGYVTSKEADVFALYLAKKITKDEKVVKIWANNLIENGKKLIETIKKIEKQVPLLKEIKKKDYNEFIKGFFGYANAHFVAKRTLDCLPKEKQEKFVSILQNARQKTENVYALVEEFIYKYISILAVKTNYSIDALLYLTNREINKYFDNGYLPSEKILLERKSASALVVDKGDYKIIVGEKDIEELEKNIVVSNNDGVLRGSPAFPGVVTGKVKVIKNSKDYKNFNSGDVLVTIMTRPEHIEFFNKASAIITDAGGILSHAAISARELKKPCIIGTNNATQILQNGDYVEVDADKGIVKILNKQNNENKNFIPKIYQEFEKKLEGHERFTFYGPHSPLVICSVAWGNEKYFKKYFPKLRLIPSYLHLVNGRIVISIIDNDAYKDCAVQKFKDFISGKVTIEQLKKDYEKVNKRINELYSKKIINPEETIKKTYDLIMRLFAVTLYSEIFTKEIAEDVLKNKINDSVWKKVANPPFDHFERRWNQLIRTTKDPLKIDFVFANYYFLPSNEDIYKKWAEEKNKTVVKKTKGYIMNKEKWMEYTQFVVELRDIRKDALAKTGSLLCKSARLIYPELTDDVLAHLNPLEIIENKKPSVEELKRRLKPYVFSIDADLSYKYDYDYDAYNKIKKIIEYTEERSKFIKGFPAGKGTFKGKVKIIFDPLNANFNKNEILVTSMTRPEFVPLMKKAGAIITNEGGVTCHAAIVSRELGIPCIIGTKNATQILKDGDLVEVDAGKGIVKILNKQK